jgi:MFS family permease
MLSSLKMSYASYVTLIGISFAAKAISLPACGAIAARYGTQKLLWVGGLGIVPISGLWLISNDFAFLVVVQTLAGMTWAAYELAMLLSFFETIRPEERTSVLTWFNLAHSLATAAGSLLGAFLLYWLAKTPQAYLLLFALSSAGRAMAVAGLWRIGRASTERGEADRQVQPRSLADQIDELPPERMAA